MDEQMESRQVFTTLHAPFRALVIWVHRLWLWLQWTRFALAVWSGC